MRGVEYASKRTPPRGAGARAQFCRFSQTRTARLTRSRRRACSAPRTSEARAPAESASKGANARAMSR
eukprot:2401944-Pleurochrysis_carterae.AAC.2